MKIPQINYHPKGRKSQLGFIELEGECIHEIQDMSAFYKVFGYTPDIAKTGILPEEFIWEKYIRGNAQYTHCLQIHLIDYLKNQSAVFKQSYGGQVETWIASHAKSVAVRGDLCAACRMLPVCSGAKS